MKKREGRADMERGFQKAGDELLKSGTGRGRLESAPLKSAAGHGVGGEALEPSPLRRKE